MQGKYYDSHALMRDRDALVVFDSVLHSLDNVPFDMAVDSGALDAPDAPDLAASQVPAGPPPPQLPVAAGVGATPAASVRRATPRVSSGSFAGATVFLVVGGAGVAAANGTYSSADAAVHVWSHPGGFTIERAAAPLSAAAAAAGGPVEPPVWGLRDSGGGEMHYFAPLGRGADALPPTEGWCCTSASRAPAPTVAVQQHAEPPPLRVDSSGAGGVGATPGGPVQHQPAAAAAAAAAGTGEGWTLAAETPRSAAVRRPPAVAAIEERKNRLKAKQRRKEAAASAAVANDDALSAIIAGEGALGELSVDSALTPQPPLPAPAVASGVASPVAADGALLLQQPAAADRLDRSGAAAPVSRAAAGGAGLDEGGIGAPLLLSEPVIAESIVVQSAAAAADDIVAVAVDPSLSAAPSVPLADVAGESAAADAVASLGAENARAPLRRVDEGVDSGPIGADALSVAAALATPAGTAAAVVAASAAAAAPAAMDGAISSGGFAELGGAIEAAPVRVEATLGTSDVRTAALLAGLSSTAIVTSGEASPTMASGTDTAVRLQALPFICDGSAPAVVVALESATVVSSKVALCLGAGRAREATPRESLDKFGYDLRWFPPMGHRVEFRTVVDASLRPAGASRAVLACVLDAPAGAAGAFVRFDSVDQLLSACNGALGEVTDGAAAAARVAPSAESAYKRALLRSARKRATAMRAAASTAPAAGAAAAAVQTGSMPGTSLRSQGPAPALSVTAAAVVAVEKPGGIVPAAGKPPPPSAGAKRQAAAPAAAAASARAAEELSSTDGSEGEAAVPVPSRRGGGTVSQPRAVPVGIGGGGTGGGGGGAGGASAMLSVGGGMSYAAGASVGMGECERAHAHGMILLR